MGFIVLQDYAYFNPFNKFNEFNQLNHHEELIARLTQEIDSLIAAIKENYDMTKEGDLN